MRNGPPESTEERRAVVRWRLRWYPWAVIGALGTALLLGVLLSSGASAPTGRLGGDYPAFYGAGRIAVEGDWSQLYEPDRQIAAQEDLYPGEEAGQYLYFAYPPFVAVAYAPLALLPYRLSFLVHALLMTAAVLTSIQLAGAQFPLLRKYRALALALALVFYPMSRAILGGQNSALTLFLIVASWRLASDQRDFTGGLVLSLLLFKPQYGVPLILLYVLAGRWRVLFGSLTGAGALYLVGASVRGIDWLPSWWTQVEQFTGLDVPVNGMNNISFVGFVANLTNSTPALVLLGIVPALATVGLLVAIWMKGRPEALTEKLALAAPGLILISPHTLFYDGALVLVTLVALESRLSPSPKRLTIVWIVAAVQVAADALGWSPLFFLVIGIAVWALRGLSQPLFRGRTSSPNFVPG